MKRALTQSERQSLLRLERLLGQTVYHRCRHTDWHGWDPRQQGFLWTLSAGVDYTNVHVTVEHSSAIDDVIETAKKMRVGEEHVKILSVLFLPPWLWPSACSSPHSMRVNLPPNIEKLEVCVVRARAGFSILESQTTCCVPLRGLQVISAARAFWATAPVVGSAQKQKKKEEEDSPIKRFVEHPLFDQRILAFVADLAGPVEWLENK